MAVTQARVQVERLGPFTLIHLPRRPSVALKVALTEDSRIHDVDEKVYVTKTKVKGRTRRLTQHYLLITAVSDEDITDILLQHFRKTQRN
jgi:hypothetical protein